MKILNAMIASQRLCLVEGCADFDNKLSSQWQSKLMQFVSPDSQVHERYEIPKLEAIRQYKATCTNDKLKTKTKIVAALLQVLEFKQAIIIVPEKESSQLSSIHSNMKQQKLDLRLVDAKGKPNSKKFKRLLSEIQDGKHKTLLLSKSAVPSSQAILSRADLIIFYRLDGIDTKRYKCTLWSLEQPRPTVIVLENRNPSETMLQLSKQYNYVFAELPLPRNLDDLTKASH